MNTISCTHPYWRSSWPCRSRLDSAVPAVSVLEPGPEPRRERNRKQRVPAPRYTTPACTWAPLCAAPESEVAAGGASRARTGFLSALPGAPDCAALGARKPSPSRSPSWSLRRPKRRSSSSTSTSPSTLTETCWKFGSCLCAAALVLNAASSWLLFFLFLSRLCGSSGPSLVSSRDALPVALHWAQTLRSALHLGGGPRPWWSGRGQTGRGGEGRGEGV